MCICPSVCTFIFQLSFTTLKHNCDFLEGNDMVRLCLGGGGEGQEDLVVATRGEGKGSFRNLRGWLGHYIALNFLSTKHNFWSFLRLPYG